MSHQRTPEERVEHLKITEEYTARIYWIQEHPDEVARQIKVHNPNYRSKDDTLALFCLL